MNIAQELSIVRDNIAEYGMTNITQLEYDAIYQQGKADAIDELFNAEIINGMTLKDVYEEASINEFDEGWNRCYEDFVEVAEQLKD